MATLKLVGSLAEQTIPADILDATKPAVPPECGHLDYLLSTPFRYGAAYPRGSRFRRAGKTLGVSYAAVRPETAVAEMVFYRYLFFADSPAAPLPDGAAEYSAFFVILQTTNALDLTAAPFVWDAAWGQRRLPNVLDAIEAARRGDADTRATLTTDSMTRLSETQALILHAAAKRPAPMARPLPRTLRGGAAIRPKQRSGPSSMRSRVMSCRLGLVERTRRYP